MDIKQLYVTQEKVHFTHFQVLQMSRESQLVFAEALLNPPAPNAAMRKAADSHERLIASQE